eukprot:scaffold6643_cov133-Isochrysis_galbana.AAC.6
MSSRPSLSSLTALRRSAMTRIPNALASLAVCLAMSPYPSSPMVCPRSTGMRNLSHTFAARAYSAREDEKALRPLVRGRFASRSGPAMKELSESTPAV